VSAQRFAGQSVPRVEDARILAGRTRFVADVDAPRQLHAVFVRSVYPHARVLSIDAEGARSLAGVKAILTLKEIGDVVRPMQIGTPVAGLQRPAFAPLAHDRVRHVGDPLAIVVAECRYAAEDAAASISVDYEPDVPVVTAEQALDPAAPLLFDEIGTNVLYRRTTNIGDVEKAFAEADLVVGATLRHQRCAQVPLETRGGLADYDRASRSLMYTASTQNPHGLRFGLAASLVLPLHDIRVVSGDVGGGFGQKMVVYREDVALCAASMVLGRPVKWIEDRVENLSASGQAREDCLDLEAPSAPKERFSVYAAALCSTTAPIPRCRFHPPRTRPTCGCCCPTATQSPPSRSTRRSSRRTRRRMRHIVARGHLPFGGVRY
jgi:carbon-monoxide dehydrogenase large subunit